jgi:hypothetical protein
MGKAESSLSSPLQFLMPGRNLQNGNQNFLKEKMKFLSQPKSKKLLAQKGRFFLIDLSHGIA